MNLVQHTTLALFICPSYYGITTLYGNFAISYLRPLMTYYDKRGGEHPYLQDFMAHMVLPCAYFLHIFLQNI